MGLSVWGRGTLRLLTALIGILVGSATAYLAGLFAADTTAAIAAAPWLALPNEIVGGVLVFTASFMITSGIQPMARRELNVRSGTAVSVALLMELISRTHPAFFHRLPELLSGLSSDMLSMSLATMAVLTLLFSGSGSGARKPSLDNRQGTLSPTSMGCLTGKAGPGP